MIFPIKLHADFWLWLCFRLLHLITLIGLFLLPAGLAWAIFIFCHIILFALLLFDQLSLLVFAHRVVLNQSFLQGNRSNWWNRRYPSQYPISICLSSELLVCLTDFRRWCLHRQFNLSALHHLKLFLTVFVTLNALLVMGWVKIWYRVGYYF